MLMSKLRPRRFTSQRIYRVSKASSSRNKMRRNVTKLVCVYLFRDNSSSMRAEMVSILVKKAKEITELQEFIQEKLQEQVNALEAEIETILKKSDKKQVTRSKNMRSVIGIARKKTIEKVFRYTLGVMQEMRTQLHILLFGKRYAPWHRIGPPNSSKICWRSAVVTG